MSELPASWAQAELAELTAKLVDGSHNPPEKAASGKPMLSARNVQGGEIVFDEYRLISETDFRQEDQRTQVRTGDVLLTIVGALGRSAVVKAETPAFTLQRSVAVMTPTIAAEPEFLSSYFASPDFQNWMRSNAKGTAQLGVYLKQLSGSQIPLPPLAEQRRIVAKLDRLSARSRAARDHLARTTTLAARAKQAVLAAALRGALTLDWREAGLSKGWAEADVADIMQKRAAYERSRRGSRLSSSNGLAADDLGALPTSWFSARLAEVVEFQAGYAYKSSWYSDSGPLLLRGANIAPGRVTWDDTKRLNPTLATEFNNFVLNRGDIVLAMDRPLISSGLKIAVVDEASAGALLVQRVARISVREHAVMNYLWHFLNSQIFLDHAIARATGGDLPHISANDVLTTPLPLPPLDEQREIVRRISSAFARIDRLTEEAARAAHLLDRLDERLLAEAFRGELVPQDPTDEPASALLARIREARAARAAAPKARRGRRKATAS